ncbi:MAG TPA: hypothetical protein VN736_01310 [Candidatus Limnocylindrales bacterium]|nr:hypothetical protein [Candidatus Limnocylindrales bacterium]
MFTRSFLMLAVAGAVALSAVRAGDRSAPEGDANRSTVSRASAMVPPVLRPSEPADTGTLVLPGPPAPAHVAPAPPPVAPKPAAPAIAKANIPPAPDPERPILKRAPRPVFPEGFETDSAAFCHKRIGQMLPEEARALFGDPKSERQALDDQNAVNGQILAFSDPTNRYRQIELDFDNDTGALRTVFVYPWKMTWQDCRREFGVNVSATPANKGRMFYSYVNRRLDVLVDKSGQVISLGMY